MHRVLGLTVPFSLIIGTVLLLGACGGSSSATTGVSASTATSAGGAPMITVSTATTAATATTATTSAKSAEVGTKENPIPLGTQAMVGDWKIRVTSVELDADAVVKNAAAYQSPDAGSQYVLVNVDATYTGEQPDSFANGLGYQIVGNKGDAFDSTDLGLDKDIENSNALVKGASVSGLLVFEVPSAQVDGAMLWLARSSAQEESGTFFALK